MFFKSIAKKAFYFFYKITLKKEKKIRFGKNVEINKKTIFEGRNFLSNNSSLLSSFIGYASYLGENTIIKNAKIGKYTSIGPDVKGIYGKHPSSLFVSTHPAFFSSRKQVGFSYTEVQLFPEFEEPKDRDGKYSIIIGNDVWIGAGTSIMDGITIGDGAIVAANALVTKNVEAYTIVGGVPAKLLKYRFNEDEINFLLRFKWWEKEADWIRKNAKAFVDINQFKSKFVDNITDS